MATVFPSVFSNNDISYIKRHPNVIVGRAKLETTSVVNFTIPVTETIRGSLETTFGLDLSTRSDIPMRWIQGDTASHIDSGRTKFENTYLVYLIDTPGSLIVDENDYCIESNTGYTFSEGLSHRTEGTNNVPRLLMGPMNEFAEPVGIVVAYYPTEADALAYTNLIGNGVGFTVETQGGFSSWRLASNSNGSSSQAIVYNTGDVLNSDGNYYLYPSNPCFLEGTKILCLVQEKEEYVPIETLKSGDLVKTSLSGYKKVELIAKGTIQNSGTDERTENRLYKCSPAKYPQLTEELYITGCHSILVEELTEQQREKTKQSLGRIFVTDKKYRLMASIDERAEPWVSEGVYTIWHIALENEDQKMNYGVYANGGLLVETCSLNFLKNKSNMQIV